MSVYIGGSAVSGGPGGTLRHFGSREGKGKISGRVLLQLLAFVRPYWPQMLLAGFMMLLSTGASLLAPYLTKIAIDVHIANRDIAGLNRIVLLFVAVQIAQFMVMYLQSYITRMVGQRVMSDLRMEIFGHLQKLSIRFFDHNSVGRLMMRATTWPMVDPSSSQQDTRESPRANMYASSLS